MTDGKKFALVTGASQGIGKAFARVLAENGCNLVIVARNRDRLDELALELKKLHRTEVHVIDQDLSQPNAVDKVYKEVKGLGLRIDYLVNNAGFGEAGEFTETDWEKERRMIDLNITTVAHFTKLFSKDMVARGKGRIVNVASTAAFQSGPRMAVYYATKAFVLSFSEAVASELEGTGVTITCLCPGPTASGFSEAANAQSLRIFNSLSTPTSAEVARFGYQAMMEGRTVAIHGLINFIGAESVRFLPRKWVTRAVRYMQQPT